MSSDQSGAMAGTRSGRWVVVVTAGVVVAVLAYLAIAMPGMDHGGDGSMASMDSMEMAEMPGMAGGAAPVVPADPSGFELLMTDPSTFVVNVHVPADRSIAGTDAVIPFDRIAGDDLLPADRATPILLYCETGRMSAEAGAALVADGYTNVTHLVGGMAAWAASGKPLEP